MTRHACIFRWIAAVAGGLPLFLACARAEGPHQTPAATVLPAPLPTAAPAYERRFAQAVLLKPAGEGDEPYHRLAPLLVHEAESAGEAGELPGRLAVNSGSDGRVDPQPRTVYWWSQRVPIAGTPREQLTYCWFYPAGPASRPGWRWLRLTLDAQGFAAVAEVLVPDAKEMDIYVSRSLEEAAAEEFGAPAPGRLAVARERPEGPVRIVRVIEDGPVPMGPMVYLDFPTRAVTTLLCRCMPSQVDTVGESPYYELVPGDELADRFIVVPDALYLPHGVVDLPTWATRAAGSPDWLERVLRLPRDF